MQRVEGTDGPRSENLGFWVWLHISWPRDLEKERDLAKPQFPSLLAACFGGCSEEEAVRKVNIVFWKPGFTARGWRGPCRCAGACGRRPGGPLKGDIPTWAFPRLKRADLLLRGESDRTSFPAFVQLAGPVPGGSRPRGQLSTTRVLNGAQEAVPLLLPPEAPSLWPCVQARHLPAPGALASFGDRGLSRPPGLHMSWMTPQQCPSPQGGPEGFPDWDISASWHRRQRPPSMGDGPEGPDFQAMGPGHRCTYHVPGLHRLTFQTSSPLSSLERRVQTGFQPSPFRGGN